MELDCEHLNTTQPNIALSVDLKTLDNVLTLVDPAQPINLLVSNGHLTIEYDNQETSCHHAIKLKGKAVKVQYYDVNHNYQAAITIEHKRFFKICNHLEQLLQESEKDIVTVKC